MQPILILAGRLRRDYILPSRGRPRLDVPGGDLFYAASGAGVWEASLGLVGRVGEDYPHEWLRSVEGRGWDTRGVRILAEPLDQRYFEARLEGGAVQRANPLAFFARLQMSFPKSLLGYQPPAELEDDCRSIHPASPRPADIPADYLDAQLAHCCPLDYRSTSRLLAAFRQSRASTLTVDPSAGYMNSTAFDDVRALLQGLTAFLPSEEELRALFWGRTDDLWEMAEALGSFGSEFVLVKRGGRGQLLYDSLARRRWEIPAYPARVADTMGAGDSFCGGFLAGYHKTYDPLRAALYGNVSASLTVEGSGAFHALETLPGLAQARLESVAAIVRPA
jgi:sugar/nucleoside kinase (ribokinase family)